MALAQLKWHKFKRVYDLHELIYCITEKWKFDIRKAIKMQLVLLFLTSFNQRLKNLGYINNNQNLLLIYVKGSK